MSTTTSVSRRDVLALGGGLVLAFALPIRSLLAQHGSMPAEFAPPTPGKPNAYIKIGADDSVTFLIPKSEMGQGPTTACSQMLAEELECDWAKVRMVLAPVDPSLYGYQTTTGSMAIRTAWEPLRRAGAEAREMLIQAAAARWNVSPSQCRAENGFIVNTVSNARINYGSIAEAASRLPVPTHVVLKQPKDFKIIGKPVKRLDSRDKINGRAIYGLDVVTEGLVYAVVERCPVFGGKVSSFDDKKARAVPGVKDVIPLPSGVAVIADSTWAAMQGRRELTVRHDEGAGAAVSSASIRQMFMERAAQPGAVARKEGDVQAASAKAAKTINAVYEVPFLAHAPMEPMNCTIHVRGQHAEAWVPTQSPTSARALIAETLGLPPERVDLHITQIGGGFGRRGEEQGNYISEAAELAKRIGMPVKVTWTREDDLSHDYYRPAAYAEMSGAIDAAGWPVAFSAKVACPSLGHTRDGVDGVAVSGLSDLPYEFPNFLVTYHRADAGVPVRYWRAPGPSQNTFFAESFFDELCEAGGKDPVEARRRLLSKTPRLLNVLNLAAERAGWGKALPPGHSHGVALQSHVGLNAQVAEVSVTNGRVRVHRVVCAMDCGVVVNPAILTQQIEGGIVFGLSATLKHAITLERGRVQQTNFNSYDLIRVDEVPIVEVHLVSSTEPPQGAGEATTPNIVPAVANAIFAATRKRIRRVPIRADDLA
jgi:isoquinoline 1-oxidoreductase beta subunit